MVHPVIPQITELAHPVANALGLQVVGVVFHTNQQPPVLRIDIYHPERDINLDDCEQMSRSLEATLDTTGLLPDAYMLEVSSPGISRLLTTDREFTSFKGFPVSVTTAEPHAGKKAWTGLLIRRDESAVHLNQKGRAIAIPRTLITNVQLADGDEPD